MIFEGIVRAIVGLVVLTAAAAFLLGLAVAYVIPYVWALVRPMIHALTA